MFFAETPLPIRTGATPEASLVALRRFLSTGCPVSLPETMKASERPRDRRSFASWAGSAKTRGEACLTEISAKARIRPLRRRRVSWALPCRIPWSVARAPTWTLTRIKEAPEASATARAPRASFRRTLIPKGRPNPRRWVAASVFRAPRKGGQVNHPDEGFLASEEGLEHYICPLPFCARKRRVQEVRELPEQDCQDMITEMPLGEMVY